jgi:hypothetical protein
MDAEEWSAARRIKDSSLAVEVPLLEGEDVLTWADFSARIPPARFPVRGTLFLTSSRLIWVRAPISWTISSLGNPGSAEWRLSQIHRCSVVRWILLWRALGVEMRDRTKLRFYPVHFAILPIPHHSANIQRWADAVNDLSGRAQKN